MSNFVNNVQTYNLTFFVKGDQEYEKTDASRVQLTGRYQIFSSLQQTTRHLFIFEPNRSRATGAIFPSASFGRRKLRFLFFLWRERKNTCTWNTRGAPSFGPLSTARVDRPLDRLVPLGALRQHTVSRR